MTLLLLCLSGPAQAMTVVDPDDAQGWLRGSVRGDSGMGDSASMLIAAPPMPVSERLSPHLVLHSQSEEYLGQGKTHEAGPLDGEFTARYADGALLFGFDGGPGNYWDVWIAAPWDRDLELGVYEEAVPGAGPHRPGLAVRGQHRACGTSHGRFEIHEFEVGESGDVTRLAADFQIYCESAPRALFGYLRIDTELTIPGPPAATPTPDPAENFYAIGPRGQSQVVLRAGEGHFFARMYESPALGRFLSIGASKNPLTSYQATFAAPRCEHLAPGRYENATRWPLQAHSDPGLAASPICNTSFGGFEIERLEVGTFGEVYSLEARFENYCNGHPPALQGHWRYRSTLPTPTPTKPRPPLADFSQRGRIYSDPGDTVGNCRDRVLDLGDGAFYLTGNSGLVEIYYVGTRQGFWRFQFYAPLYRVEVGHYEVQRRYPAATDETAMSISTSGRGCDRLTGSFTVHRIKYADDSTPEEVEIEFVQHCGGREPALRGWLQLGASGDAPTPLSTRTPTVRSTSTTSRTLPPTATPTVTPTPIDTGTLPPTRTPTPTPTSTSTRTPIPAGSGCSTSASSPWGLYCGLLVLSAARRRRFRGRSGENPTTPFRGGRLRSGRS
jgi:hypothetical protein